MRNNRYNSEWINNLESELHWRYYWQQQNLIRNYLKKDDTILEIGVGTKFASNYLKSKGFNITTIDIDKNKSPDIVADISNYKFKNKYDHVLAFEVFEHIPFDDFLKSIENLSGICKKNLFISLPRNEKVWFRMSLDLKIFKISNFQLSTVRNKILSKHHFWEIDYQKEYKKRMIIRQFEKCGFKIIKTWKFFSLYYFAFENTKNIS